MKVKKTFRVLAALPLGSASGRKILNGVHRFLGEGYDWDIELLRRDLSFQQIFHPDFPTAEFDGILVAYAETPEMKRRHLQMNLPAVFVDYPDPIRNRLPRRAFVHDDERSIANAAALCLLAAGNCRAFGYVPSRTPTLWSDMRERAFAREIGKAGHSVKVFRGDGQNRLQLTQWLQALEKPAAVLAAFDDRAVDVLEACRGAGISMPGEVAVLGIGNDELVCEATLPPLSSVAVDFELQGYRAARELHALMLGGRSPRREIRIGARETILRQSTSNSQTAARLADRAMTIIRERALTGISSRDVVSQLQVSRRLADLRFRQVFRKSMLQAITELRLQEVKRLLLATALSADQIAGRCGYRNAEVLRVLFKRATGLTLRQWRIQAQGAAPTDAQQ